MDRLKEALHYLSVDELKGISSQLSLIDKGGKGFLISRILHYLNTGKAIKEASFPESSLAKRNIEYPLHPDTPMMKGAYKNDLKNRLFFKQIIGEHFHFTAYGIDWLNDRWMNGTPPTYQEFADMWQSEHIKRKQNGSKPKEEWAYIKFMQDSIILYPNITRDEIIDKWKIEKEKQKSIAQKLIEKHLEEIFNRTAT